MSTIVTRAGKGSPLTNNEVDANFVNLNTDKIESITSVDGSVVISPTGTTRDLSVGTALNTATLISQVRNETGATLTKGTVVYVSGASSNKALVSKALANADATSAQTYGVIQADIPTNQNGYVVVIGVVSGLDTSAFANGTQLYLSGTTAGTYTSTKPYAPIHLVYVGIVTYQHANQGTIEVKIQNGYEMDELHDVAAQSPTNGQTLVYNASNSLWEKNTVSLTAGVNGVLPTANGGTNLSSFTANGVVYASSSSALATGSALTFDGTFLTASRGIAVNNSGIATSGFYNGVAISGYDALGWSGSVSLAIGGYRASQWSEILFYTNGTEKLRLTSSSLYTASGINVGIGTDTPLSRFNIKGAQGNWRVDADSVSSEIQLLVTNTVNTGFLNYRIKTNETIFETGGTERIRITSTGIFKKSSSNGGLQLMDGNTAGGVKIGAYTSNFLDNGYLAFEGYSIEYGRFDALGNLCVGSSSAGNAASVNISVGSPATTTGGLQLWSTTTGAHWVQFGDGTTGADPYRGAVGYLHASDAMSFYTSAAEQMRISSVGNLNIINGSLAVGYSGVPATNLDVRGSGVVGQYLISTSASAQQNQIVSLCNNGGGYSPLNIDGSVVQFKTSGTIKATVSSTGLDVTGVITVNQNSTGVAGAFANTDATNGYGVYIHAGGSSATRYALVVRDPAGNQDWFKISSVTGEVGHSIFAPGTYPSSEIARVTTTGLGIGTNAPRVKLNVDAGAFAGVAELVNLHNQGTSNGYGSSLTFSGYLAPSAYPTWRYAGIKGIYDTASFGASPQGFGGKLSFFVNRGTTATDFDDVMTLTTGGNVAIGRTDAAYKLDIFDATQGATTMRLLNSYGLGTSNLYGYSRFQGLSAGNGLFLSQNVNGINGGSSVLDNPGTAGYAISMGENYGGWAFLKYAAGAGTVTPSVSMFLTTAGKLQIGTTTNVSSAKLIVAGGLSVNNNTDNATSPPTYGQFFGKNVGSVSPSTTTTIKNQTNSEAAMYLVSGLNSGIPIRFFDIVVTMGAGMTPVVVSSGGINAPPARTYSMSGENLQINFGGANAFDILVTGMGANEST